MFLFQFLETLTGLFIDKYTVLMGQTKDKFTFCQIKITFSKRVFTVFITTPIYLPLPRMSVGSTITRSTALSVCSHSTIRAGPPRQWTHFCLMRGVH